MKKNNNAVEQAIYHLKEGKMIILLDDKKREDEADLVMAGEFVNPETMNFIIKNTGGVVCISLEADLLNRFNIPMSPVSNSNSMTANFSLSIDAVKNSTTGISAADRVMAIKTLLDPKACPDDLRSPGHLFPLKANPKGVFGRRGHTEGSLDLLKIGNLKPLAIISELMNKDGSMMRGEALYRFARQHKLPCVSIEEIVTYRLNHENWVELYAESNLPSKEYGELSLKIFRDKLSQEEITVIHGKDFIPSENNYLRLHSACFTGDLLDSERCDCGEQFKISLKKILQKKGLFIYLPQEGRGIGLGNKIKAYALQDKGLDTVEANQKLGFKEDERDYAMSAQILKYLKVMKVSLLTNNPKKIEGLKKYGIKILKRIPIEVEPHSNNIFYLQTKKNKLGHLLSK